MLIETNLFVAHGRQISQFYLKEGEFSLRTDKHFQFRSQICFIFKRRCVRREGFSVGVLLENGEVHVLNSDRKQDPLTWDIDDTYLTAGAVNQVPGEVFSYINDPVQFKCNLFLTCLEKKEEDESELEGSGSDVDKADGEREQISSLADEAPGSGGKKGKQKEKSEDKKSKKAAADPRGDQEDEVCP